MSVPKGEVNSLSSNFMERGTNECIANAPSVACKIDPEPTVTHLRLHDLVRCTPHLHHLLQQAIAILKRVPLGRKLA